MTAKPKPSMLPAQKMLPFREAAKTTTLPNGSDDDEVPTVTTSSFEEFDVKLIVRSLEGCDLVQPDAEKAHDFPMMMMEL